MQGWPQQVVQLIELVLIARGGAKAISITAAVRQYTALVDTLPEMLENAMTRITPVLEAMEVDWDMKGGAEAVDGTRIDLRRLMGLRKQRSLTAGCLAATRALRPFVAKVATVTSCSERLFVAGDSVLDGAATVFVPGGFKLKELFEAYRCAAAPHLAALDASATHGGWPPPPTKGRPASVQVEGDVRCASCGHGYSSLWIQRGVCRECESALRREGRCPFREKCAKLGCFCPHAARCFLCDAWACDTCGMLRGDGEDVLCWAATAPDEAPIFLDFDRTLASTKGGANPALGVHSVDAGLLSLLADRPNIHIVTRNRHGREITAFLEEKGARRGSFEVHCVSKRRDVTGNESKAAIIAGVLARASMRAATTSLFVDDDVAEHFRDGISTLGAPSHRLTRMLFVRG
eukprot:SAG31_NODE_1235_length_9198_cov_5.065282_3_plen_405_part_00